MSEQGTIVPHDSKAAYAAGPRASAGTRVGGTLATSRGTRPRPIVRTSCQSRILYRAARQTSVIRWRDHWC